MAKIQAMSPLFCWSLVFVFINMLHHLFSSFVQIIPLQRVVAISSFQNEARQPCLICKIRGITIFCTILLLLELAAKSFSSAVGFLWAQSRDIDTLAILCYYHQCHLSLILQQHSILQTPNRIINTYDQRLQMTLCCFQFIFLISPVLLKLIVSRVEICTAL